MNRCRDREREWISALRWRETERRTDSLFFLWDKPWHTIASIALELCGAHRTNLRGRDEEERCEGRCSAVTRKSFLELMRGMRAFSWQQFSQRHLPLQNHEQGRRSNTPIAAVVSSEEKSEFCGAEFAGGCCVVWVPHRRHGVFRERHTFTSLHCP
jgi:hypothetical protein